MTGINKVSQLSILRETTARALLSALRQRTAAWAIPGGSASSRSKSIVRCISHYRMGPPSITDMLENIVAGGRHKVWSADTSRSDMPRVVTL